MFSQRDSLSVEPAIPGINFYLPPPNSNFDDLHLVYQPEEPMVKVVPLTAANWRSMAKKMSEVALTMDNGIPGVGERIGFAAVLYANGIVTNFHKHYPNSNLKNLIPYEKVSEDYSPARSFMGRADDATMTKRI